MTTCARKFRNGGECAMPEGHRGRCSSQVFECDTCGKTRRGNWRNAAYRLGDDDGIVSCFFCQYIETGRVVSKDRLRRYNLRQQRALAWQLEHGFDQIVPREIYDLRKRNVSDKVSA